VYYSFIEVLMMARRKARKTTRYFVLRNTRGDTDHVFTGSSPRRGALKAATRGFKDIKLRERGTRKIHNFVGSRKMVKAPEDRPDWLPAKVWKPVVRKKGIEHLDRKTVKKKTAKRKTVKRKTKARRARRRR
jgi:hypothetical protein